MKLIYLVTQDNGFFAQKIIPWESMDTAKISEYFFSLGFTTEIITYSKVIERIEEFQNELFVVTSSQCGDYKAYLNDIILALSVKNKTVPSLEQFQMHENKGLQLLMSKVYQFDYIQAEYIADTSDLQQRAKQKYPLVMKRVDGASAEGVYLVKNQRHFDKLIRNFSKQSFYYYLKKFIRNYILKPYKNTELDRYREFGYSRLLLQKFIPNLKSDYKVLVFGDKYYVLKRFVKGEFKASGSGLFSFEDDGFFPIVLDYSRKFVNTYSAPIYSLDIILDDNLNGNIVEVQFTHVGPLTLVDSVGYYSYIDNEWIFYEGSSNLEKEFVTSVSSYIRKSSLI